MGEYEAYLGNELKLEVTEMIKNNGKFVIIILLKNGNNLKINPILQNHTNAPAARKRKGL